MHSAYIVAGEGECLYLTIQCKKPSRITEQNCLTSGLSSLAILKITAASRAEPIPDPGGVRLYFFTTSSSIIDWKIY